MSDIPHYNKQYKVLKRIFYIKLSYIYYLGEIKNEKMVIV